MNKITLSTLLLFLVSLLSLQSCKKDIRNDIAPLSEAKNWYVDLTSSSKIKINSSQGAKEITQSVQWDKFQQYVLKNGKVVFGAPIDVKMSDGKDAAGSFLLIIERNGDNFSHYVTFNSEEHYFDGTVSNAKVEAAYDYVVEKQNSIKEEKAKKANVPYNGKVMVAENPPALCIDWYWTTTVYDSWGNVVEYYETYLYTTCVEVGGGGGGGNGEPDPEPFIPDFGYPVSVEEASSGETNLVVGIDSFKVKTFVWRFHEGYTWHGRSRDHAVVRVKNGIRTWENFTHVDDIKVGIWSLGDAEIVTSYVNPHFTVGSTGSAYVEAKYRIKLKPLKYLGTYDSDFMYSYLNSNVNLQRID